MILTRKRTIWRCLPPINVMASSRLATILALRIMRRLKLPSLPSTVISPQRFLSFHLDNFEGGKLAARALVKAGCQRIVMITGYDNSDSPTGLRQLGFNYELDKKVLSVPFQNDLSLYATRIRNQIYHFS